MLFPTSADLGRAHRSHTHTVRPTTICCWSLPSSAPPWRPTRAPQGRLTQIASATASKYDCAIAIGVQTKDTAVAAASPGITEDAPFVWGSVTKLLTGTAIMRAVEKQTLQSLHAPISPILDPVLRDLGLGTMAQLFGPHAKFLTAKHLAEMRSGVPDYDTAKPWSKPPKDAFRAQVYSDPSREYDPKDILNVSWVATGSLDFFPGLKQEYSSTNFVLLGLLLAALEQAPTWDAYDQRGALDALPASRRRLYDALQFAVHGAPSRYTSVHGYDRTSYNGHNASQLPGTDVWKVKGVYGGWTASDVTGSVADTARLAYDIFGASGPRLLAPPSVETMIPRDAFYGLATFNLTRPWGAAEGAAENVAYGHLGATYGYQSILAYFPDPDVSISIASDIETDDQIQPADGLCLAYNAVLAAVRNTSEPACRYVHTGYYGGRCDCGRHAAPMPREPAPSEPAPLEHAPLERTRAQRLEAALTPVVQSMADKYNCSVSIASRAPTRATRPTFHGWTSPSRRVSPTGPPGGRRGRAIRTSGGALPRSRRGRACCGWSTRGSSRWAPRSRRSSTLSWRG